MMKLGIVIPQLKKFHKIYKTRDKPRDIFHQKLMLFVISKNKDKSCILLHNLVLVASFQRLFCLT